MNQVAFLQIPPSAQLAENITHAIGIDGGGTSTRAVFYSLKRKNSDVYLDKLVNTAQGEASALGQGVEKAFNVINGLIMPMLEMSNVLPQQCVLSIGLSGANQPVWLDAFKQCFLGSADRLVFNQDCLPTNSAKQSIKNVGQLQVLSDALAALLGANNAQPCVLVGLGTGSMAQALDENFCLHDITGWGFPIGDEGSGAWLGLRATLLVQRYMDGFCPLSPLIEDVMQHIGETREKVLNFSLKCSQNECAALAQLVFAHEQDDGYSRNLIDEACNILVRTIHILNKKGNLPTVISGSIAQALYRTRLSTFKQAHITLTEPRHGAAEGALLFLGFKLI